MSLLIWSKRCNKIEYNGNIKYSGNINGVITGATSCRRARTYAPAVNLTAAAVKIPGLKIEVASNNKKLVSPAG